MEMTTLFSPLQLRGVTFRNRIGVSPMCQYSATDGLANDWHFVHLGSRAVGGAGLVIVEATAVSPEGRISPGDLGLWKDEQVEPLARCARFMEEHGAVPGIQLAHAGRKASTTPPWQEHKVLPPEEGGWRPLLAPSPVAFDRDSPTPEEMSREEIRDVVAAFSRAAQRAVDAGFRVIEIHAAHGYLLHEFLSPLSNFRGDEYGGEFENRIRFLMDVALTIRSVIPDEMPLMVRISATDWVEGGWDLDQSMELAKRLALLGVDLVDCSSGGLLSNVSIPATTGYQIPFAETIRHKAGVKTAAVGLIRDARLASQVIESGKADLVLMARHLLRDPYWPLHAAQELGYEMPWPVQYRRVMD